MLKHLPEWLQQRIGPFYRAWIATITALIFGLAPILCAWARFAVRGKFLEQYRGTIGNGDVLMIACSLAGPALVLAFKRRDPETMGAPQLTGLIGICVVIACIIIFLDAYPLNPLADQFEQSRVLIFTYILLPISVAYSLLISYWDERSTSLKEFARTLDTNGTKLEISFPGGTNGRGI